MKTIQFLGFDCLPLANSEVELLITRSVGPRIISLRFHRGGNLLAALPEFVTERPDGKAFHFYGGHRLWHAPEGMPRTYVPDDKPVQVRELPGGLRLTQAQETETGIEKSIQVTLVDDKPQVILRHTLTNHGLWAVECAPWAITQFRMGGVAILPQSQEKTDMLPNRSLAIWPYSDMTSPHLTLGNEYILVRASMPSPFKLGFANPRGWLAYCLEGTLFVKRAAYDPHGVYPDLGSSSECYCNDSFLELETLAPLTHIPPGGSVEHTEIWELHAGIDTPQDEAGARAIADQNGLE